MEDWNIDTTLTQTFSKNFVWRPFIYKKFYCFYWNSSSMCVVKSKRVKVPWRILGSSWTLGSQHWGGFWPLQRRKFAGLHSSVKAWQWKDLQDHPCHAQEHQELAEQHLQHHSQEGEEGPACLGQCKQQKYLACLPETL
jgi:hypothetical protein